MGTTKTSSISTATSTCSPAALRLRPRRSPCWRSANICCSLVFMSIILQEYMCLFSVTVTPNVQSYRTLGVTLVSESLTGRGAGLQFYLVWYGVSHIRTISRHFLLKYLEVTEILFIFATKSVIRIMKRHGCSIYS